MEREQLEIGMPDKISIRYDGANLEIARKWFGARILFMTFFVIFWDGFLAFWYLVAIKSGNTVMLLFPLIHVTVGIFLTYLTIAGYLNKTYVRVSNGELTVRHRPLPWIGNKTLRTMDLKQLYSKEMISRTSRGGSSASYHIHALTHGGKDIRLVSGLETSEQALYIEQEIEKYLGIRDMAVRGEISR